MTTKKSPPKSKRPAMKIPTFKRKPSAQPKMVAELVDAKTAFDTMLKTIEHDVTSVVSLLPPEVEPNPLALPDRGHMRNWLVYLRTPELRGLVPPGLYFVEFCPSLPLQGPSFCRFADIAQDTIDGLPLSFFQNDLPEYIGRLRDLVDKHVTEVKQRAWAMENTDASARQAGYLPKSRKKYTSP